MKEVFKKYGFFLCLLVIYLLTIVICAVCLKDENKEAIYVQQGESIICYKLTESLYSREDELYITVNDALNIFQDLYYDKLSRCLVITKTDEVIKYKLDIPQKSINFEVFDYEIVLTSIENDIYIKLSELLVVYDYAMIDDKLQEIVLVSHFENARLENNRIYINNSITSKKHVVYQNTKLYVYSETDEYAKCCIMINGSYCFANIPKEMVVYDQGVFNRVENSDVFEKSITGIYCQSLEAKLPSKNEIAFIPLYSLYNALGDISIMNNSIQTNIIPIYTNGYDAANYNDNISLYMLSSEVAREKNIKLVIEDVMKNEYNCVVIDFGDIRDKTSQYYNQYIKEFVSYAHSFDIDVGVYYTQDVQDYKNIDIVIYQAYEKNVDKVSTLKAAMDISDIQNGISKLKNMGIVDRQIVMEIPVYSVLLTIKNNLIVKREIYNMSATKEFIEKNNLSLVYQVEIGQKHLEFLKGELTYKMWIEDVETIRQKISYIKECGISGYLLYKNEYMSAELLKDIRGE